MELGVVLWKEVQHPTPYDLQLRLEAEGFSVMQWQDPPGAVYEDHSHDHDESIWLFEGGIDFLIAESTYTLNPGDRLFLPKHTIHSASVPLKQAAGYLIGQK